LGNPGFCAGGDAELDEHARIILAGREMFLPPSPATLLTAATYKINGVGKRNKIPKWTWEHG
jgi:hypothetical protein